jgi:sister chromatid cohesion protein DCC1
MLVDTTQSPEVIRYFPEKNLPDNIQERFESLFGVKQKWTLDEIEPFVSAMTTASLDVNAILTKYARAFKVKGVKFFSSKYGK